MSDKKRPTVGTGVLIHRQGKFLFGKRKGPRSNGTWSAPGGHLEHGETIEECSHRETQEETGIEIQSLRFLAITEDFYPEQSDHYITIWSIAEHKKGEAYLASPEEFETWEWVTWDNLPQPLPEFMKNFLKLGINPLDHVAKVKATT